MKVKKYTAPTMPEAMKKVRQDLGAEAVILNSKAIYLGGFLGLFKKKNFQVIAALDKQVPKPEADSVKKTEQLHSKPVSNETDNPMVFNQAVLTEIREMKKWIEKSNKSEVPAYPLPLQTLYYHLLEMDVNKDIIKEWLDEWNAELPEKDTFLSRQEAVLSFSALLKKKLSGLNFSGIDYNKKFVHLVGPTGVGKTTTIAKLAANCILKDKKRVALITTDTYRIAAIDQLKAYARILGIPLEVAYTNGEYLRAREKFQDYDLVLVDTAGRNFRNQEYVKELGSLIDLDKDVDTYLVLSLTSKFNDQKAIFNEFNSVPIKQFIYTKEDETSTYGSLINMMLLSGKGIAFITNGQEVPDNISEVSIEKINNLIVGEYADA